MRRLSGWLILLAAAAMPAVSDAAEALRVGNDAPSAIAYCPLDYGLAHGMFAARGLALETSDWFGATKGQSAVIGGAVDLMLGSGAEMAYVAKGAPELAVAVAAGPPANIVLVAARDSAIKGPRDLAGQRVGITTVGGLTDWLMGQVMRHEGYAKDALTIVTAGGTPTQAAMLTTGGLDAALMDTVAAFTLQSKGGGRIVLNFGSYVPDFVSTVMFARRDLIEARPAALRDFLAVFFDAQTKLLADTAALEDCAVKKDGVPPDIAAKVVAEVSPAFSRTGRFPPAAMALLAQSFVETGVLADRPDPETLFTEAFLPH